MNLGFDEIQDFIELEYIEIHPSAWTEDLLEYPEDGMYKFTSVSVDMQQKKVIIARETYDLLTWMGDIGGLADCLYYFCHFVLMPFTTFTFNSALLRSIFRLLPKAVHVDARISNADKKVFKPHLSNSQRRRSFSM